MSIYNKDSVTLKNLESAFAGESMAHMKYLHFAKIARENGDEEVAKVFEATAQQEIRHALSHAELLYPKEIVDTERALNLAIAGETYEYTEMYPGFKRDAEEEGQWKAQKELDQQIAESKEHAALFQTTLNTAAKRFTALAKVEERHAKQYQRVLDEQGVKA